MGRPRTRFKHLALVGAIMAGLAAPSAAFGQGLGQPAGLESAPVPSLCDHPAGTLVNHELPGIAVIDGYVRLDPTTVVASPTAGPGGTPVRAAVVRCNRGGVGWPDNVVFYSDAAQIVGAVELRKVTQSGRESVRSITVQGPRFVIAVGGIELAGEPSCCGTGSATVTVQAKDGSMQVSKLRRVTDRSIAKEVGTAIRKRNRKALRRLSTSAVTSKLLGVKGVRSARLVECRGGGSEDGGAIVPGPGERLCHLRLQRTGGRTADAYLFLKPAANAGPLRVFRAVVFKS